MFPKHARTPRKSPRTVGVCFLLRDEPPYLGFGTPALLRKLTTADIDPTKASCAFFNSYSLEVNGFLEGRRGDEFGDCGLL